jgi:diaminohydroxyphosphoribosylaminopyrimidine deaminase / 5-amino-6-(5-phosphoribosylamino)uracil reductase
VIAAHAAASEREEALLARARDLALCARGRVSPNPLVGAVVLAGDAVVGEGWHEGPGTPHAEVVALRAAGPAASGATLVCTLEPCSHHGRTPPCTDAVRAAGVRRVVIGALDPLERGRAGGAGVLAEAGIEVALAGAREAEACRELNAAFVTHALTGRPLVTLKMAASLDGRVATEDGETRWITGPESRAIVHRMRADADAVAVGVGTALADDPLLTARDVEGPVRQPRRVVFDSAARLPPAAAMVRTAAEAPVTVVAVPAAPAERVEGLRAAGVEVLVVDEMDPGRRIGLALDRLGAADVQSLLLEGGPRLAGAFLAAGAVDRVAWFTAPVLIGGSGAPAAVGGPALGRLAEVPRLRDVEVRRAGGDVLVTGRLRDLPDTPAGAG